MKGEKVTLPDVRDLAEIRFFEARKNGGYTNAVLKLLDDGGGTNIKESRYDDPTVYKSEKPVDDRTVKKIKDTIAKCLMFGWHDLPLSDHRFGDKKIEFVFKDKSTVTVNNGVLLPNEMSHGFFDIELEMTTKH